MPKVFCVKIVYFLNFNNLLKDKLNQPVPLDYLFFTLLRFTREDFPVLQKIYVIKNYFQEENIYLVQE